MDFGDQQASVFFSYGFPIHETMNNGEVTTVALGSLAFGMIFFLESLIDEQPLPGFEGQPLFGGRRKRSIQEDQLEVFRQIEDNLSMTGMDGHACVLRFICELQHNRFSGSSIFGELFTLMFTPKQGQDYTILKEYIEAEMRGQDALTSSEISKDVCSKHYGSCVWSVFDALRKLVKTGQSSIADRPQNYTNKLREDLIPHQLNEI